jgi:hypothetical protein
LEELYDLLAGDSSSSYNAYSFFAGQYHTSVSGLNKGLSAQGFPHIEDNSYHLTNFLNFTWKRKHIMNEIFIANGVSRSVSKGDISVSYGYISPVNYNIGYCVIDKKRIQFFPYAGLLYQSSNLDFINNGLQPFDLGASNYDTLIKSTINKRRGVEYKFVKRELTLNYGCELDFHIVYSKRKTGFILGLRAGGGFPLLSSGWKLDGIKYTQFNDVKVRNYYFDVVLRVYNRRHAEGGKYYLRNNWWEN